MNQKLIAVVKLVSNNDLTVSEFDKVQKALDEKYKDKNAAILLIASSYIEKTEVFTFYEPDFTEVKYEELKKIIRESFLKQLPCSK